MARIFKAFHCDCCNRLVDMDKEPCGYFKTAGGKEYFLCQNCSDSLVRRIPTPEERLGPGLPPEYYRD